MTPNSENETPKGELAGPFYDPLDPNLRWVIALAEGFKLAGCERSPIVPDPKVIADCIRTKAQ